MAFLIGGSHASGRSGTTVGTDYEFRFHRLFGVAGTAEYVAGDFRDSVGVMSLMVHPTHNLRLSVGPGIERAMKEEVAEPGEEPVSGVSRWHKLFRIGANYDFHLKHGWTVGPDVALDFAEGRHVLVVGLAIGRGFNSWGRGGH